MFCFNDKNASRSINNFLLKYANEVIVCQYRHKLTVHVNADQTNIVT